MIVVRYEEKIVADGVVIANRFWTRLVGLLNRSRLEVGEGLLLRPCNSVHTLFMKFPLDIIFMDREKRIVRIFGNIPPFRVIPPLARVEQVLELPAGCCHGLGLVEGMILSWDESNK